MAKDIRHRVADSFDDKDREDILKYMEWLRENIAELVQSVRRTVTFTLLLMAAFGLVSESKKSTISIGSFQISNGSLVIVFLPALVAYLSLQVVSDSIQSNSLQIAFTAAFRKWSAKAERNDLDMLLFPTQALYWNPGTTSGYDDNRRWLDRVRAGTSDIIGIVVSISILAFEGWAYYKLGNYSSAIWIISVCMTVLCLTLAMIQYIGTDNT